MAASTILNLYLAILDHPRSSLMDLKRHRKFGVNRTFTFEDIVILKFWKFDLKRLYSIQSSKIYVFGGFNPQMLLFIVRTPKGTSLARNTRFEPSLVAIRRAVRPGRWAKSTKIKKGSPECMAKIWVVTKTLPVNRSLLNFACRFVSRICFLVLSFRKIGWKMWELWGSKFRLSHCKGTSLIQLLVATTQAVISAQYEN